MDKAISCTAKAIDVSDDSGNFVTEKREAPPMKARKVGSGRKIELNDAEAVRLMAQWDREAHVDAKMAPHVAAKKKALQMALKKKAWQMAQGEAQVAHGTSSFPSEESRVE